MDSPFPRPLFPGRSAPRWQPPGFPPSPASGWTAQRATCRPWPRQSGRQPCESSPRWCGRFCWRHWSLGKVDWRLLRIQAGATAAGALAPGSTSGRARQHPAPAHSSRPRCDRVPTPRDSGGCPRQSFQGRWSGCCDSWHVCCHGSARSSGSSAWQRRLRGQRRGHGARGSDEPAFARHHMGWRVCNSCPEPSVLGLSLGLVN